MRSFKFSVGLLSAAAISAMMVQPAAAQSGADVQKEIIGNVIQNIVQTVRDEVSRRRVVPPAGTLRFSGESSDFDGRDLFAQQKISNPFGALGYAKAPALVAATPSWLYGANLVGSVDHASAGVNVNVETVVGAFDITKIGVFGATDALTFIGTGGHSWSNSAGMDGSMPSTSATVSYLNGGFSADASVLLSWSRSTFNIPFVVPTDGSSVGYTFNTQYRFDFPYSVWFEPTVGVTYSESYGGNFGNKTGDSTEIHGGARIGTEMNWMGYKVQPTVSAIGFRIVDSSGFAGMADLYGIRGSAKMNVIWTQNFSSYLEVHGTAMSQQVAFNPLIPSSAFQTIGAQAGLRYTW
ncbi:MAG: autotransporter domain-containing protein [Rhizobiales bacterium]|nr:autotransporter domain-containing protein [Hyphomicrobiales bacterium]